MFNSHLPNNSKDQNEIQSSLLERVNRVLANLDNSDMMHLANGQHNLCGYSPYSKIKTQECEALVKATISTPRGDRAIGCLCGMAIADAIGAPLEFLPVVDDPADYIFNNGKYTKTYNKFNLKTGQWTDDASMGLCMADSLILKRGFDGSDMRLRFFNWWTKGYNNAFKNDKSRIGSVGLGGNISKSIRDLVKYVKKGVSPPAVFREDGSDAGNGSLMRLAPISIFFHRDLSAAREVARKSSVTTHPGPIAAEACAFTAHLCAEAITHQGSLAGKAKVFIDHIVEKYLRVVIGDKRGSGYDELRKMLQSKEGVRSTELSWNWRSEKLQILQTLKNRGRRYNGYPVSPGYYGSYSMDGLALALHCAYTTNSFEEAVTKCVNKLGDADSTGSITGQIAGAMYGYSSINPMYIKNLNQWDDGLVALRGTLLVVLDLKPQRTEEKHQHE